MFRLTHYVVGLSVNLKSFSLNHNQGGEGIRKSIFTLKTPIKYVGEDRAAREDEKKIAASKTYFILLMNLNIFYITLSNIR